MKTIRPQRMFTALLILISFTLLIGCETEDPIPTDIPGYNDGIDSILDEDKYTETTAFSLTDENEDFVDHTENDFKYKNTAIVELDDDNTVIHNEVEDTVIYMEDGNLIVDSTKKLTLVLSGTLNGSVNIYKTDGKLQLILDGVDITSDSGPAINLQTVKRCFMVLNHGTVNNVKDGTEHPPMLDGSMTKAAIFSEEQLIISGTGELNVNARYKHGIASDEYLRIWSGDINVYSTASDGLHAKDYIIIDGGNIHIEAKDDGIEVTEGYIVFNGGSVQVTAGIDGIKTTYDGDDDTILSLIYLNNGYLQVEALQEGLKSTDDIILYDGAMIVNTLDDCLSALGTIRLMDGVYHLYSTEKQTLDGDEAVVIEGGLSVLHSEGDTATIESDDGIIALNGGIVVAAGPYDMSIGVSLQGFIKCGNVDAFTTINIKGDSNIMSIAFLNAYGHVIVSTPGIDTGDTYDIYSGGTKNGDNFYGLYVSGTYRDGTLLRSVVAE